MPQTYINYITILDNKLQEHDLWDAIVSTTLLVM